MKIVFIKFAGMASGGTEKYLQSLAILYKQNAHDVDYYYTNAAPITSGWVHPDNDDNRINLLKSKNINILPVYVGYRHGNMWHETNFFDVFKKNNYDILVTAGDGSAEFPYTEIKDIPIIHTIHGEHVFNQVNIKKSVLLCKWQSNKWLNNGGDIKKLEIIPSYVPVPETWSTSFRKKYKIPEDAFVFGFHQRNDNQIASNVSLTCFKQITIPNTYFCVLGGSDVHRNFVTENKIQNVIFIDHTSNVDEIHEFLDGIDVYAHCRNDGEVCSAAIIEAMYHGKPIISAPGMNMGHEEQLDSCGKLAYSLEEYHSEMIKMLNKNYYNELKEKTKIKYKNTYDYKLIENKFKELL
jgi:glycosyltransferase involved in cell wall biosynthesis